MLDHQFLDNLERSALATKEDVAKDGPRDIAPYAVIHRGEHPIAVVTMPLHERDTILLTASFCASAFAADSIGIVFETYQGVHDPLDPHRCEINPLTGKTWGPGEMDDAAKNHEGIAKGWLNECVSMAVADRAGDFAMTARPFSYTEGRLVWLESENWSTTDGNTVSTGIMPRAMRHFMTHQTEAPKNCQLSRDELDLASAAWLTSKGNAVHLYALVTDEHRQDLLKRAGGTWTPT
jgi:hypothetical protein